MPHHHQTIIVKKSKNGMKVIDFKEPFIIDTPGRSLSPKNMERVFDHLFDSNRQVILLPEASELDPDVGDDRYAPKIAASYELNNVDSRSNATERFRRT